MRVKILFKDKEKSLIHLVSNVVTNNTCLQFEENETMSIDNVINRHGRTDIELSFNSKEERNEKMAEYMRELDDGIPYEAFATEIVDYEGPDVEVGTESYGFTMSLDNNHFDVAIVNYKKKG